LFTTAHFGRKFSFWRHPLDYDVNELLPTFEKEDNWLVRLLSNEHEDVISFKELGVAKQILRQCSVIGTLEQMEASIIRISDYFGWIERGKDVEIFFDSKRNNQDPKELGCVQEILEDTPPQTWLDHASDEWKEFYMLNKYDCQLYEIAESTWRGQMQTSIPYSLQMKRANNDEEEEAK